MSNQYPHFSVGEIAIFVRPGSPHYGQEVRILSTLQLRKARDLLTGKIVKEPLYEIHRSGAKIPALCAHPQDLKKKPPREDLKVVPWSECLWQPKKVS